MKKRRPKKTDQEEAQRACELFGEVVEAHPEFEPNIWVSAVYSILINTYLGSGSSFEEFCGDMERAKEFYKKRWEAK